jgi:pimeloyl-ACP methyl ester carboxylesterase
MAAPSEVDRVSRFVPAPDGLRLHYLEYGAGVASDTVAICLPGLSRTAEDFDRLARALAIAPSGRRRRILSLDYRGRGLSGWDPDPTHYALPVEHTDILAVLDAAGVASAIFIGTSRGGLHTMVMAATQPARLRAGVLNDIGPTIERAGLMRIKGYVGKLPPLRSWDDAVALLRKTVGANFTSLSTADWNTFAHLTYREEDGEFRLPYDPQLARNLDATTEDTPMPDMWPQFEAMANVRVLSIRGENSDILSADTQAEMARRHPNLQTLVVPGQGHPPLLLDTPTIAAIEAFIGQTE